MRVIGGELRSRRIKSVAGRATRPTPDRLREALFNVLAPRIEGCLFLDAYAGSGAVGIEALSRGARRAVFLEKSREAVRVIHENLGGLGLESRAKVIHGAALAHLGRLEAEIVFLDPPYELEGEYEEAMRALGAAAPPLAVVQHDHRRSLEERYGGLERVRLLRQGDNTLSFFERRPQRSATRPSGTDRR
jgi:16S rRNA (guanine(966)-N(2))-methyltransferase RsmD